jgi:hypothetical protein
MTLVKRLAFQQAAARLSYVMALNTGLLLLPFKRRPLID